MEIFVLVIPGVYLLSQGIRLLRGGSKSWFFSRNIYKGGICYAQIPGGLALLFLAIAAIPQFRNFSAILVNLAVCCLILGLIFNFIQPSFLKPNWLKWLEREHRDIMPVLINEAHAIGLETWEKRVQTRAKLEDWVTEVRRKHGLIKGETSSH